MSYTIEYARKVFKIPEGTVMPAGFGKDQHVLSYDNFFVFTRSGCNNINPRPRNWHLAAFGWSHQIINTVCERAGWTEGGRLKLVSGDTSPESYLKMYRKEIKKAPLFSLVSLQQSTGIYGGYICLGKQHEKSAEWFKDRIKAIKVWFTPYGDYLGYFRYDIRFSTFQDFRAFLVYKYIAEETGGFEGLLSYQHP